MFGVCLGKVLGTFGGCLWAVWGMFGGCLADVWPMFGGCLGCFGGTLGGYFTLCAFLKVLGVIGKRCHIGRPNNEE